MLTLSLRQERQMQEIVRPYAKSETIRITDLPESAQSKIGMLRDEFQEQAKSTLVHSLGLLEFLWFFTCFIDWNWCLFLLFPNSNTCSWCD